MTLLVDISLESDTWLSELPDIETLVHRVAQAARSAVPDTPGNAELSVLLSGDANIRRLNRDYRDSDAATNVLAFGNYDQTGPTSDAKPVLIGDVVMAFETVAREAADQKKPLSHHVSHLLVHGVLHLLGYNHDGDAAAHEMEDLERAILAGLGISDPYAERDPNEHTPTTASGVVPYAQGL